MSHTLMLIPTSVSVGLTSIATGLLRAIDNQGVKVSLYNPIQQTASTAGVKESSHYFYSVSVQELEEYLGEGRRDELLENLVGQAEKIRADTDILLVQGLIHNNNFPYAAELNLDIAKALGADIILVSALYNKKLPDLYNQIEIMSHSYGESLSRQIIGCIINKVGAPTDASLGGDVVSEAEIKVQLEVIHDYFKNRSIKLLGCIPWRNELVAPRMKDVCEFLDAAIINEGAMHERRISRMTLCARSLPNIVNSLKAGTLIVTAGDRADIILATAMAALTGIKIAGLVLTGGYEPDTKIMRLCEQALKMGLPILSVTTDSFRTATRLQNMPTAIPADDVTRLEAVKNVFALYIDTQWIRDIIKVKAVRLLSPSAFRYKLVEKARAANKRIILPEGNEPRTIAAAAICASRHIARCVLLGYEDEIKQIAANNAIELSSDIEIINPHDISHRYIQPLVELRKHKGMTDLIAKEELQDNVMLGTMMLQLDEVDGLVSGALHTTANTIRPALQIIKTSANARLVSSIFFMCLPDQVLVYGDCAINPDPDAEQLADIAIQSADSAATFGIMPRIAMISYSTGNSGAGADVDKVKLATMLVKAKRPDLLIDGPLQYDAALIADVAKTKAPDSQVAGKATIFIFPDLNTGNTTYKAVQRSADVLCLGPMLQGLRKPVNDLSRGATIEDIVYTIALTAIQADQFANLLSK